MKPVKTSLFLFLMSASAVLVFGSGAAQAVQAINCNSNRGGISCQAAKASSTEFRLNTLGVDDSAAAWNAIFSPSTAATATQSSDFTPASKTGTDSSMHLDSCYSVKGNSANYALFVPLGTPNEFVAFKNRAPAQVAECSACGSAASGNPKYASPPPTDTLCSSGNFVGNGATASGNSWMWQCQNSTGDVANCSVAMAPNPCTNAAPISWTVSGQTCTGTPTIPAGGVSSAGLGTFTTPASSVNTGTATFTCSNGSWSTEPTTSSCTAPAPPPPAPSSGPSLLAGTWFIDGGHSVNYALPSVVKSGQSCTCPNPTPCSFAFTASAGIPGTAAASGASCTIVSSGECYLGTTVQWCNYYDFKFSAPASSGVSCRCRTQFSDGGSVVSQNFIVKDAAACQDMNQWIGTGSAGSASGCSLE